MPNKPANFSEGDRVLVKAFQAGKKDAFDKLVLKHKDRVFNLCYRMLGDYQEANDSAQDTFMQTYRSLKKFRFESAFSTWLYRVAVNTCKNKLRSSEYRLRKKTVSIHNPGDLETGELSAEVRDDSPSPVAELERNEKSMLIQRAIDSLPVGQKTVVTLRDIEGLSYEEISRITHSNLGTVKSRLARGRQDLKKRLRRVLSNGMCQD